MTGVTTIGIIGVAAAATSAGVGVYDAVQSSNNSSFAHKLAGTTFGEQQQYAQMLYDLVNNPSSVTSTPGYNFQFQQGQQAVERANAAGGFFGSGNEAIALTQYGQQYATSALTQQENLYASLSGLQTATSPNAYLTTGQNSNNSSFNQFGQVLQSLGYVAGRGNYSSAGTPAATTPYVDMGNQTSDFLSNNSWFPTSSGGGLPATG